MILSNLSYVMSQVIPQLFDCFVSHGYPQCPEILEVMRQLICIDTVVTTGGNEAVNLHRYCSDHCLALFPVSTPQCTT